MPYGLSSSYLALVYFNLINVNKSKVGESNTLRSTLIELNKIIILSSL